MTINFQQSCWIHRGWAFYNGLTTTFMIRMQFAKQWNSIRLLIPAVIFQVQVGCVFVDLCRFHVYNFHIRSPFPQGSHSYVEAQVWYRSCLGAQNIPYPYHQCMAYLPTFGGFLRLVNVGKYTSPMGYLGYGTTNHLIGPSGVCLHHRPCRVLHEYSTLGSYINWVVASNIFFIFIPIWEHDPIWLVFFKWVETAN